MIFQYQKKARKAVEVLNDLVMIQNERLAGYHLALESANDEPQYSSTIKRFIDEGLEYKYQLIRKLRQIDGDMDQSKTLPGRLYKVWGDLKKKFTRSANPRAAMASCQYNEMIALHVANAAMLESNLNPEVRTLIEQQEAVLRGNMDVFRTYSGMHHLLDPALMYFN